MKLLWRFVWIASLPVWAQVSPTINQLPSREFGQSTLLNPPTSGAPNLIEGREFDTPLGIAFAPSGGPMYVADASNNRVLAWRNPGGLTKGNHADLVVGQRDLVSNLNLGPGTSLTSGLSLPSSVAVDSAGNLYVLDDGNNRIVRYPNPFNQTVSPLSIDLVIGQKTQSTGNIANENNPKPSNHSLSFSPGGTFLRAAIALDAQGNLWVTDAGNNRVLRFPVAQLAAGTIEPVADLVLGQTDFVSNGAPNCGNNPCQTNLAILLQPQSLAFDGSGALYVADSYARVLYYPTPNQGVAASQVLGVIPAPAAGQQVTFPNSYSLGNSLQNAALAVFATGNQVFVGDAQANRVVRYTAPAQFVGSQTTPSPQIEGVIGQPDLVSGKVNRGSVDASASSLSAPLGGAFDIAGNLWVLDSNNNRVLSYPANGAFSYFAANIVVGQTDFPYDTPNLIEGREVWFSNNGVSGGGIAVDTGSTPPHLYIADTYNNRVLGFLDARAVGADVRTLLTQKPDLVIGQPAGDFFRSIVNYPNGDPDLPTSTGLLKPVGVVVDTSGNLWVADSGNGRVLRFPAPFSVAAGTIQTADTVVGQNSLTNKDQSTSAQTMNTPYGLALFPGGHLAVSDPALNRVLVFRSPLVTGETASTVVGQANFSTGTAANTPAGLNSPRHVATDTVGRLYVADYGNNRLVVFQNTSNIAQTGASANFNFPFFTLPQGIAVSQISGEMWVTSAAANTVYHLPEVTQFSQNTSTIFQQIPSYGPLAIALDSSENPIVAEVINRVAFYFAQLVVRNAFSFTSTIPLTPGMWAQAAPIGKTFNASDEVHQNPPYPTTAAGLQMLVNGTPSGIYSWEENAYMNFVIPWEAPSSGTAEYLLFNPTTKEIVAAGTTFMDVADPAFRTTNFDGFGQVLAINFRSSDGTSYGLNSPQNPIALGDILQLALTGQGLVNNPPADGFAPSASTPTNPLDLVVFINGIPIPPANIQASQLDPTYPGSWTINVKVPTVAQGGPGPCNAVVISVIMRDVQSLWGYDPNNGYNDIPLQAGSNTCPQGGGNGRATTFAVKAP